MLVVVAALFTIFFGAAVLRLDLSFLIACAQTSRQPSRVVCQKLLTSPLRPTLAEVADLNRTAGIGWLISYDVDPDMAFVGKAMKHFIASGVNINAPDLRSERKVTALHVAAGFGDARGVELLLEHGADRTLRNALGQTPLEVAKGNAAKYPAVPDYQAVIQLLEAL